MIIRSDRLIFQARVAIQRLMREVTDRQAMPTLQAIDAMLNEVMLRNGNAERERVLVDGQALVERVRSKIGACVDEVAPSGIDPFDLAASSESSDDRDRTLAGFAEILGLLDTLADRLAIGGQCGQHLLDDIVSWEERLYWQSMATAPIPAVADLAFDSPGVALDRLEPYLRKHLSAGREIETIQLDRLPGGFSKSTVLARCLCRTGEEIHCVIRIEPQVSSLGLESQDLEAEYWGLRSLENLDIPIARPILFESDDTVIGYRFMISSRCPGENLGDFRSASAAIPQSVIASAAGLLAKMGRMRPAENAPGFQRSHLHRWMAFGGMRAATEELVRYWFECGQKRKIVSPALRRVYRWLLQNIPAYDGRPSIVHGDFGFHNILVSDGRLSALLDWEASYVGDSTSDLANLLFGTVGMVDRAEMLGAYHACGGDPISPFRLSYFEVFNAFKMTLGSMGPAMLLNGAVPVPASFALLNLNYTHFSLARINDLIHQAEALRDRDT